MGETTIEDYFQLYNVYPAVENSVPQCFCLLTSRKIRTLQSSIYSEITSTDNQGKTVEDQECQRLHSAQWKGLVNVIRSSSQTLALLSAPHLAVGHWLVCLLKIQIYGSTYWIRIYILKQSVQVIKANKALRQLE